MKQRKKILSNLWLSLGLLAGSIPFLLFSAMSRTTVCHTDSLLPDSHYTPDYAEYYAFAEDGRIAVSDYSDRNSLLLCGEPDSGALQYMLGTNELSAYCGPASRRCILFGRDGELFLHYVTWSENMQSAIDGEYIVRITPEGVPQNVLCGFSYTDSDDPPTRTARLSAFKYHSDTLEFAYTDTAHTAFYQVNTLTGTQNLIADYSAEPDGSFITQVFALDDSDYLLCRSDGAVFRNAPGEPLGEPVYQCTVDLDDPENTDLFSHAAEVSGTIYVTADYFPQTVYRLENNALEQVTDLAKLSGSDEIYDEIVDLCSVNDSLMICTPHHIYSMQNNTGYAPVFRIPAKHMAAPFMKCIGCILLILGCAAFAVRLILIRKSILFKQLLLMLPAVGIVCFVILFRTKTLLMDTYYEHMSNTMLAACEVAAESINGDELEKIEPSEPQCFLEYRKKLLRILKYNRGYWEGSYNLQLCLPTADGLAYVYVDTAAPDVPFRTLTIECDPADLAEMKVIYSDSSVFTYLKEEHGLLESHSISYYAVTPIKDSAGNTAAYLLISTDEFGFDTEQRTYIQALMRVIIPPALLLLLITTVISIYLSRIIKHTIAAVNRIAEGDFSARVENASNDELGDICRQVNAMAGSLETMFREKDENERFYYKFVPEKFRELLGKQKLTELSLGDAASREFTVLFCDIRSFSITSETMTAAETFEFVNVVFGIAGPIVRKHHGFVDKYIGDAVMALFESADDAVAAGIELYRAIDLDPKTAERLNVTDISIGVGIHTGMARIGIVGEEERLSGTVISDTVNLSSRLESLTKTYQTAMLISKSTLDRMSNADHIQMRYLGLVQVAGVNDVESVYEVLDCLDDERRTIRTENASDFREAVRLFHLGHRTEAADLLRKIIAGGKGDHIVKMYLEYITNMKPDDKGNVFRFVKK